MIVAAGEFRTVVDRISDTSLKVDPAWTVSAAGTLYEIFSDTQVLVEAPWLTGATDADYIIAPLDSLDHVNVFLYRTGLRREQLGELFDQNLNEDERRAGAANEFFINATGEDLPALHIELDDNDPSQLYSKIVGLSYKRLDRLNRFIRLANHLNWSYADLNWALVSTSALGSPGLGTVTITKDSAEVIGGPDTHFDSTVEAGDVLICLQEARTVTEVISPDKLTVNYSWNTTATTPDYRILRLTQTANNYLLVEQGSTTVTAEGDSYKLLSEGSPVICSLNGVTQGVQAMGLRTVTKRDTSELECGATRNRCSVFAFGERSVGAIL